MTKKKITYIILIISIICLGLVIRKYNDFFGSIIGKYAPDALWSSMVFFIFRLLINKRNNRFIFISTLVFSCLIELSQLYHSPWIDSLRNIKILALIIGSGFLWSDIVCYFFGACFAWMMCIFLEKTIILV